MHRDHKNVAQLFSKIERTSDRAAKTRARLFETLQSELTNHAQAEERTIYPRLQQVRQTAIDGYESEEEHDVMKSLISKLEGLDAGDERWMAALTVLKNTVVSHVEKEESRIFREMRKVFSKDELRALPEEFEAAKGGILAPLKKIVGL